MKLKLYRLAKGVDEEAEAVPARVATLVELSEIVDRGFAAANEKLMESGDASYPAFLAALTGAIAAQIQADDSGFIWVIPEQSSEPHEECVDYAAGRRVLAAHQGVHPDRCQGLADAIVDAALGILERSSDE